MRRNRIRDKLVETHGRKDSQPTIGIIEHERHGSRLRRFAKRSKHCAIGQIQRRGPFRERMQRRKNQRQARRPETPRPRELIPQRRGHVEVHDMRCTTTRACQYAIFHLPER